MARQLLATRKFVTLETPIAVTSFVELKSLQKTSELGNQMAESFIHHLQANGYRVIEYKAPGYIKVTDEGDFALSRDYEELTGSFEIDYILTGTYSAVPQGMMVNVRMFAAETKIVVATAQGFVPNQALSKEPIKKTDHQALRMEHGSLVRSEPDAPPSNNNSAENDDGGWL
nr:FlgO family outer membrane protein [Neiella litorisoli]